MPWLHKTIISHARLYLYVCVVAEKIQLSGFCLNCTCRFLNPSVTMIIPLKSIKQIEESAPVINSRVDLANVRPSYLR